MQHNNYSEKNKTADEKLYEHAIFIPIFATLQQEIIVVLKD